MKWAVGARVHRTEQCGLQSRSETGELESEIGTLGSRLIWLKSEGHGVVYLRVINHLAVSLCLFLPFFLSFLTQLHVDIMEYRAEETRNWNSEGRSGMCGCLSIGGVCGITASGIGTATCPRHGFIFRTGSASS